MDAGMPSAGTGTGPGPHTVLVSLRLLVAGSVEEEDKMKG